MPEDNEQSVILIVEDDASIREIVGRVLQEEGYRIETATNGLLGLEQFYKVLPDLIIQGLELGADDYLVKPFGVQELIARVGTVLRRAQAVS